MSKIYDHVRHPRAAELAARKPVSTAQIRGVDNKNWLMRFNARFGLKITVVVGTMWTAYLFMFLAMFALPDAIKKGTYLSARWCPKSASLSRFHVLRSAR
jgi:hypothetical protein